MSASRSVSWSFSPAFGRICVSTNSSEDAEFQVGPYTFRPSSKNLVGVDGAKLRLTEKEAAILRYLHRADQQPVAREMLLKHVWGYNSNVTTHTLETHIYRLRQKIESNPADAQLLVTEGGGYKLIAGVPERAREGQAE